MPFNKTLTVAMLAVPLTLMQGCIDTGGSDSDDNTSSSSTARTLKSFPTAMIVSSPTDTSSSSRSAVSRSGTSRASFDYQTLSDQLEEFLDGTSSLSDISTSFDPNKFFTQSIDASCYGPQLQYQNHPDGTDDAGSPPSLPTGDLGIWNATQTTGEACAAAELNAQLAGVQDRVFMSMMGLGSMIVAYESLGNTWPDDVMSSGTTGELATTMNSAGVSNVSFTSAQITYDSSNSQFSYVLKLVVTRDSIDYQVEVDMTYDELASDGDDAYESSLVLLAEDSFDNGSDQCTESVGSGQKVTRNSSLHFISNSASDVRLQARDAMWCGHFDLDKTSDSVGLKTDSSLSSNLSVTVLEPNPDPDSNSGTVDGWQNNFAYFTADFNPTNLRGDYAYVWQAGPGDSHSRILNVGLEVSDATVGESYFGYGNQVQSSTLDGSMTGHIVQGFICNWAGPGQDHTLKEYAQRQHITLSDSSGLYEPSGGSASSSNITYAPTKSCEYDSTYTHDTTESTFLYDRDLDSDLTDESTDTSYVSSSSTLKFDLMDKTDGSYTGTDIADYIQNGRGYDLPDYPN